jgi:hypothetical protein
MLRFCLVLIGVAMSFSSAESIDCNKDPCASSPCLNKGVCQPIPNENRKYTCQCSEGYVGTYCEVYQGCEQKDPCNPSPCKNGGACTPTEKEGAEGYQRYTCTCTDGFLGFDCEVEADPCESSPCKKNEVCERKPSGDKKYTCTCPPEWSGCDCNIERPKGCPDGFVLVDAGTSKSCYKINEKVLSFDQAAQQCNSLFPQFASGFAILTTEEENNAVKQYLKTKIVPGSAYSQCTTNGVWFGMQRDGPCTANNGVDNFVWKSSSSCPVKVDFKHWTKGEPNCAQNIESCAHMWPRADYDWNDLNCATACCSLCEVNL